MEHAQLWCRREGRLGRITLDRPERINALSVEMVRGIGRALDAWVEDPGVELLVLDGAGERGFCAGGDLGAIHRSAVAGGTDAAAFWREEYALDLRLARFPKPVVALLDGIVMGGGLGLTVNADLRVVTERSVLAMPETAIGLSPDVGAGHFLGRIPGRLGVHLAVTGARLGPAEAIAVDLADVLVHSERLDDLVGDLQSLRPRAAASRYAVPPGPPTARPEDTGWIEECYDTDDPVALLERLSALEEPGAERATAAVRAASPTAVAVTLRAMREARRHPGLLLCLERDYRVCLRFLSHPDLLAGTGSIVAKSGPPHWSPSRLDEVSPAEVDRFFAPLPRGQELVLPRPPRPQCAESVRA